MIIIIKVSYIIVAILIRLRCNYYAFGKFIFCTVFIMIPSL